MRKASFFLAAAVLAGLVTTTASANEPNSRHGFDGRADIQTVSHPGRYDRDRGHGYHSGQGYHSGHSRYGYYPRHHYSGRPVIVYPRYPSYPPVYRSPHHICGSHCGPHCGYAYPPNNLYYRGNGWGFSFGF